MNLTKHDMTSTGGLMTIALMTISLFNTAMAAGAGPSGMMTRDELRDCMKLQQSVDTRAKALDQANGKLQSEKEKIAQASSELETLRSDISQQSKNFTEKDQLVRNNTKKLQAWNKELHQIAASPNSTSPEKRKAIEADYANLSRQNKDVIQERDGLYKQYSGGVKQFNIKAASLEKELATWNTQNKKFNDDTAALASLRTDYASRCTNRPFLEADRLAVQAGQ